jgi:glutamyl-Q tRNA(Asp) synthetase
MNFPLHYNGVTPDAVHSGWRTRFAPSPTGFLHLGHVAAALFGWGFARGGGAWLVRLEDIDPQRCRPEFSTALLEDLAWLGLESAEPVLRQSERMAAYGQTLAHLHGMGVLYPCFCTRSDIQRESAGALSAPHTAPDGSLVYPGTCRVLPPAERARRIEAGQPYVLRLDMACALEQARRRSASTWPLRYHDLQRGSAVCAPELFGDVVLARRDVPASYHLCVSHDDAAQGITLVTRGEDLRPATDLHRLLQELMGWPVPAYCFHPLLCDAQGRRLAKRAGARSIRSMRAEGLSPEAVKALAGMADMPLPGVKGRRAGPGAW